MLILLTIVHVIVCLFLILVVLLQSGKAADLAGAFGGMGSQTAFGPRGAATALSKATTVAAALFMITSMSLAVLETRSASRGGAGSSVLDKVKTPVPAAAPATPAPVNPAPAGGVPSQPQAAPEKK
jgi:preprotein translocase subunit SecG